jgi:hypothetical protein
MTESEKYRRILLLYEEIRQLLPRSQGVIGLSKSDASYIVQYALLAAIAALNADIVGSSESDVIKQEEEYIGISARYLRQCLKQVHKK